MYKKILVPLDGSELAECVLGHVESIAKGCEASDVIFLRVATPPRIAFDDAEYGLSAKEIELIQASARATAQSYLNQLVDKLHYDSIKLQKVVLDGGQATDMIADYATKNNIDLIIIATHGRSGVSRWVWGSVADRILRSACVPVLMVRAPGCFPGI